MVTSAPCTRYISRQSRFTRKGVLAGADSELTLYTAHHGADVM